MTHLKRIEVVAAIIHDAERRIFATQREYGEWKDGWEFPGGKDGSGVQRGLSDSAWWSRSQKR